MKTVSYLQNLNNPEENIKLAQKLPNYLIDRWNRIVDSYIYKTPDDNDKPEDQDANDYPTFTDFCQFVSGEARLAFDAHVPRHNEGQSQQFHKKAAPAKQTTLTTATTTAVKKAFCFYCKAEHPLWQCSTFLSKSADFKKSYAREHGFCFGCLNRGHIFNVCKIKNRSLMKEPAIELVQSGTTLQTGVQSGTTLQTGASQDNSEFFSMILPVVVSHVSDPERKMVVYAVIDTQSDCCFVSDEVTEALGIDSKPVELELTTMGNACLLKSSLVFGLSIRGLTETRDVSLPKCFTRETIPSNRSSIPTPKDVRRWSHLEEVADQLMPKDENVPIGMLIGHNCPSVLFPPEEYVRNDTSKPFGYHTILGWTVMGRKYPESTEKVELSNRQVCFLTGTKDISSHEIKRIFDQDYLEPTNDSFKKMSFDDRCFLEQMKEGIKQREDGHYQLPLPFRDKPEKLPNNRTGALRRLLALKKRLQKDPLLRERYRAFMDKMFDLGHAEPVPLDEVEDGCFWYISHHGVYHAFKPDKLRVVFDCSAEFLGVCLNSLLLVGPDLVNSLIGVLCRFRQEKYAFTCDVEGMFHQVFVAPEFRQYLRFLWYKNGDPEGEIEEYQMAVHLFGASSSPGCANLAFKQVAEQYGTPENRAITEFIKRHFYVDDGLKSTETLKEAFDIIIGSNSLCNRAGFNLTKFVCNSEELTNMIPERIRAEPKKQAVEIKEQNAPVDRTLGLLWERMRDVLLFMVKMLEKPDTKRGMLSALSSVYDPLGLVSPLLLAGRRLLQSLCVQKLKWDELVDEEIAGLWKIWYTQLQDIQEHSIPRCIRSAAIGKIVRVQLLTFADASTYGFGACCYLKLIDEHNNQDVNLVFAKSKVLPIKPVTIPRMELQAAVLGTKMSCFLRDEFDYPGIEIEQHFWSDSKVVLGYLTNSSKKFQLYVANRVYYIRNNTGVSSWHHVPSISNPADVASRGCDAQTLINNSCWWKGPHFLQVTHDYLEMDNRYDVQEDDPEVKRKAITLLTEGQLKDGIDFVIDGLNKLSSWKRMTSVVGVWKRYMNVLRDRISKKKEPRCYELPFRLNVAEKKFAESCIIQLLQKHCYPEEYQHMLKDGYPARRGESKRRKSKLKRANSNLYKLDVYMDEDLIIRVGGRLKRANLPRDLIHPFLLPGDHHITECLVQHIHHKTRHQGRGLTLNALRAEGFWITSGRSMVERYIRDCVICQALRGMPMKQKMSDLPTDRMEMEPPFTYVGSDFFGPFMIKCGRAWRKRWGCVFTCLCCRAIHIEIVHSMDTSSFINAYRRFIHRRGPCRWIRCDCGSNFIGAKGELEKALSEFNVSEINAEMLKDNCDFVQFKFNFPKSSHMGGAWERMIKSIRQALSYLLSVHGDNLDDELLLTLMTEAEAIVNARPMTYVDMSRPDQLPITPAQILTLKTAVVLPPPGEFVKEDLYARKRWRRVQFLANQFWYRWRREYLSMLQERSKWIKMYGNLKPNDVVLLTEEGPRNKWPKAIVQEVYPGEDGLVRRATVKTKDGMFDRPIHKLVFLHREGEDDD